MGMESFDSTTDESEKFPKIGEKVKVLRSDGSLDEDWILESIGGKYAVVEKENDEGSGRLRKLIPVEEFNQTQKMEQTIQKEKPYEGLGTGSRGREKSPRVLLRYHGYEMGDKVVVERSDGSIETDWDFVHQRMDTGDVVVRKMIDGELKEKEIPPYIFDAQNKSKENNS